LDLLKWNFFYHKQEPVYQQLTYKKSLSANFNGLNSRGNSLYKQNRPAGPPGNVMRKTPPIAALLLFHCGATGMPPS
jgi:hypothetical protein